MKFISIKKKQEGVFDALKSDFKYTNKMQAPKLVKVVINTGIGKIKDKKKLEIIPDRLAKITGQKPSARPAKKSIASFKLREGEIIGQQVTLRGANMFGFLDKLINVAIPRMRDFKGLDRKSIDEIGNLTIGIKEHTVFPEATDEELVNVFGFAVTLVTTAKTKKEADAFFTHIGIPFKK